MKKFLFMLAFSMMLVLGFTSCKKGFVPENTITKDKAAMCEVCGDNYTWFETTVRFVDYLDEETDGTPETVISVFGTNGEVYAYTHTKDEVSVKSTEGIWVGDFNLNKEEIKLTFKDAFERVMAANYPKPHSRYVVLRREVGPVPDVNAQYVFGNKQAQLYVDAVTGEVSDTNPAFKGYEDEYKTSIFVLEDAECTIQEVATEEVE